MNVRVRVTKMEIIQERDFSKPDMPQRDVTKVHIAQETDIAYGDIKDAYLLATVRAGVPNPFTLGQRLVLLVFEPHADTMDPAAEPQDHIPAAAAAEVF